MFPAFSGCFFAEKIFCRGLIFIAIIEFSGEVCYNKAQEILLRKLFI